MLELELELLDARTQLLHREYHEMAQQASDELARAAAETLMEGVDE